MFCPKCGTGNGETARFCQKCGETLGLGEGERRRSGWRWTQTALLVGLIMVLAMGSALAWRYWSGRYPGVSKPVAYEATLWPTEAIGAQESAEPAAVGTLAPATADTGPIPAAVATQTDLPAATSPAPTTTPLPATVVPPTMTPPPTATPPPTSTPPPTATPLPTASPTSTPIPPTPRPRGRIVFATSSFGYSEICVINADGSNLTRITSNQVYDWHPNWSPDGRRIVFATNRDGSGSDEIYTMNPDGSGVVRLTYTGAKENTPVWHPDGSRIFFSSERDGNWELYSMRSDGSDVQRLTNHPALDDFPAIAPDGRQMAFASERDGTREIYVANIDGSNVRRLTNRPEQDWAPAWSPLGNWIAFASEVGENEWALFLVRPDGSDITRLTYNGGEYPAWSPDGTKIVFLAYRNKIGRLYIINADGSSERQLTQTATIDWSPAWFW
jgi:Tol biopolymer transport system component